MNKQTPISSIYWNLTLDFDQRVLIQNLLTEAIALYNILGVNSPDTSIDKDFLARQLSNALAIKEALDAALPFTKQI